MSVYLPCLNVDSGNSQSGSGIQLVTPQSIASGLVSLAGQAIPVTIGETVLYLNPFTAIASFLINWNFWADLFGLGEGRIAREKATIQQIYSPIFQYLAVNYSVPITDFHALDFPSDGVQQQYGRRPDIAALVPGLLSTASPVCNFVFASRDCSQGQLERIVNQFLANAAYNGWPVSATQSMWDGIVESSAPTCAQDPNRWLKNPQIVRSAAVGAAILQYIPLSVLADMAVGHHIGDPLLESLLLLWANNPQLVSLVPPITGLPWQSIYTSGSWALPPYGGPLQPTQPLLSRDHIQPILSTVQVPLARYPDFGVTQPTPASTPPLPIPPVSQPPSQPPAPQPQPQPQPPTTQPPQPPTSQPPTTEVPPAQQQPTYTQAQLDYACGISKKLYSGIALTDTETAWYNDVNNVALLNLQINNPACKSAPQQQPSTPQQPPPPPPPSQQTPTWTQSQLDYACTISRLLYGNAPLTPDEMAWYNDPVNNAILNYQLNNPLCKTPLTRETPNSPAVPTQVVCPPTVPQQSPQQPQGPGPVTEIPGPTQPPTQPPSSQPCPPDCVAQIQEVDRKRQECCDEIHNEIIPRIVDLESWVYDIETRVPGPPPTLPFPEPIPPTVNLPGTPTPFPPPDIPVPPELPPVTDCDSPFVQSLLQCIIAKMPPVQKAKKLIIHACDFGKKAWGIMAECWCNQDTATPDADVQVPQVLNSLADLSNVYKAALDGSVATVWDVGRSYGTQMMLFGLGKNTDPPQWPFDGTYASPDYVFVPEGTDDTVELDVVEV